MSTRADERDAQHAVQKLKGRAERTRYGRRYHPFSAAAGPARTVRRTICFFGHIGRQVLRADRENESFSSQQSRSRDKVLLALDMCFWVGGAYVTDYNGNTPRRNMLAWLHSWRVYTSFVINGRPCIATEQDRST